MNLSPSFRPFLTTQSVSKHAARTPLRASGILAAGCDGRALRPCLGAEFLLFVVFFVGPSEPVQQQAPASHQLDVNPLDRPQAAKIERGGAAVTLETSEPLFQLAAALNACGYDADLDKSAPVRAAVRAEMNAALAASEDARKSRDELCAYIAKHHQNDMGLDVGQYVSLALYLVSAAGADAECGSDATASAGGGRGERVAAAAHVC